jgi:hypothetical protein
LGLVIGAGLPAATGWERDATASVSIAVTWDGLLRASTAAAVVLPVESRSIWENGRIYTYTRVSVERAVAGTLPAGDAWVRTMGGVVEKIGQSVEGEAVLSAGQKSLLFVHDGPVGALEVTARGQGQFPIVSHDPDAPPGSPPHVVRSRAMGAILAPALATSSLANRLAADVLHGRPVDDAATEIAADWSRTHAR